MAITAEQIAIIESFAAVDPRPSLRAIGKSAHGASADTVKKYLRRANPGRISSSVGVDGKVRRFPTRRKRSQIIMRKAIEMHARELERAVDRWEGEPDFIKRIHAKLKICFAQHL